MLLARNSGYSQDMAGQVAEMCEERTDECEQHDYCQTCAEALCEYAEICRTMASA